MILSDQDIEKKWIQEWIGIQPYNPEHLQPASYDLTLGRRFLRYPAVNWEPLDPRTETPEMQVVDCFSDDEPYVLNPGEFTLGATVEYLRLPSDIKGQVDGKSSLGRLGLLIHSTSGNIDPGFEGTVTLELFNLAPQPIMLWPNMKIAHLVFQQLSSPARKPYGSDGLGSKYQGQVDPTASRFHENYEA